MRLNISLVDLLIVILYFFTVMLIGLYFTRREKTSTHYFLAGRDVAWWAIGASLFASNISSEHFIGLAGSGAKTGLAVGHFEWLAVFCCLTLGWVFVPFYIRSGVFTMPEFLERRYGTTSRMYLTVISIVAYVLTKISVTLVAGSLLLKYVVGWDMMTSSIFLVCATGLYTVAGGLSAVIYTEVLQTVVLIGGAVLLTGMGLYQVGGWNELVAKLDAQHFSMFKEMHHPDFPWTGIVFGAPILGIWYWCTDQFIVQRVLSAKNISHARSGAIFAGYLKVLPVFIMVLPGMIAAALYPSIDGDTAYPALVTRILPMGLKGIVIAGLLAAIMSSLASCFNSCSTLITIDFYKKIRKRASERELVFIGRFFTTFIVILGVLWIPFMDKLSKGQLYVYMQSVQGYISPPIAACFLFGIFFKRLNGFGAITSLLAGFVIGTIRLCAEMQLKGVDIMGYIQILPYQIGETIHGSINTMLDIVWLKEGLRWMVTINFLHFAILLFGICTFILFFCSLITRRPDLEKIRGLTYATAKMAPAAGEELLMSKDESPAYRTLNIILSLAVAGLVGFLWYTFF